MRKLLLLAAGIALAAQTVYAQYTKLPEIPAPVYNIKDYGAVGDNKTLNTQAIQKALDQAKATGGRVVVPAGDYLCGPLTLGSRTQLDITKGATLRLRNDMVDYPSSNGRYLNFLEINKATDIRITGGGTIDGQGAPWWEATTAKTLTLRRPQMLYIEGVQRVEISGVTLLNPPNTHLSLKRCADVYIHDITIQAPGDSRNTDGINLSAKNCTIERCTISTGDDDIAVNFGNKQPASDPEVSNLLIRDCKFEQGHGLSIGSFTSGGLSNMRVSNCRFDGTTAAIRIKTARGRGGVVDNVTYENITIANAKYPIFISGYYPHEPKTPQEDVVTTAGEFTPVYKNIVLKNITVTNSQEGLIVWGLPESPIQNVRFENVKITAKKGAQLYNVKSAEFSNSSITAGSGEKLRTYQATVTGLN